MSHLENKDLPVIFDKKEAVAEIKKNVKVKWKRKFELSEKVDNIQEVFTEVGCRNCFGEEERESFSALNQVGGKKGNRTEPNRTNGLYRTEPTEISDCNGTGFYLRHRTEPTNAIFTGYFIIISFSYQANYSSS